MYLVDEIIDINWALYSDPGKFLTKDLFDVITISPGGISTYHVDPIINWIMPYTPPEEGCNDDIETIGNATYAFTASNPGRWKVLLISKDGNDYEILDTVHVYAICDITAVSSDITALATRHNQAIAYCGTPPVVLKAALIDPWQEIQCIGRHAEAGKIVWMGSKVGSASRDIGVVDVKTGVITEHIGAIDLVDIPFPTNLNWSGIDCDRSTGIYVAAEQASIGNEYPAYWATSLTGPWTKCSSPSTLFHNNSYVRFDNKMGVWFWQAGTQLWTSADGKTFSAQPYKIHFNQSIGNIGYTYALLDSAMNPLDSDVMMIAGNTERNYRLEPYQGYGGQPFEPGCFVGLCNPAEIKEVTNPDIYKVFNHAYNSPFQGGVCAVYGDDAAVFMMAVNGEIIKNDSTMQENTWEVLAERDFGQNPPPPYENELLDNLGFCSHFQYINGKFYCRHSIAGLVWEYEGVEPRGYGWVVSGNNGFFSWEGVRTHIVQYLRVPDEVYAYCGRKEGEVFDYHVWYDGGIV